MNESNDAPSDEAEFDQLICRITADLESSNSVAIDEYLREYPQYADRVNALFPTLQALAELGRQPSTNEPIGIPTPTKRLGDFEILEEIGRGGMGVVYEAVQVSLQRRVALKVLPFATVLDQQQLRRFKDEAQIAARLNHPHIVPVYAVGSDRGVHFYAMQFIEGRNVAEMIQDEREEGTSFISSTSPTNSDSQHFSTHAKRIAGLGVQAAQALHHAHEEGIVHRDIKPSNLMLDNEGKLWVTDFGLARIQSAESITLTGNLVGTLRYMSPEQVESGEFIDRRTDVYSLGATLYELLTLQPVHDAKDHAILLRAIAEHDPPPLRRSKIAIPRDLGSIILKSLEKAPGDRYAAAEDLAEDLQRFIEDQPVRASRPGLLRIAQKRIRRNFPLVFSILAVVLLSLLVLTTTSWIAWHRIRLSNQHAVRERAEAQRQSRSLLIRQANDALKNRDPISALMPLSKAVGLHEQGAEPSIVDRIRFATAIRAAPELVQVFDLHRRVDHFAVSADGNYLACFIAPDAVEIRRVADRAVTARIRQTHVSHLEFSPVHSLLAIASSKGQIQLWDAVSGQPRQIRMEHDTSVCHVSFSMEGRRLLTSDVSGKIRVWELASGNPYGKPIQHGNSPTSAICARFDRDASNIVSASQFDGIRTWDALTGEARFAGIAHDKFVTDAHFTADGEAIWSATTDGRIRRFQTDGTLDYEFDTVPATRNEMAKPKFGPFGRYVVSARALHGGASIHDIWTGKRLAAFQHENHSVIGIRFSPERISVCYRNRSRTDSRLEFGEWCAYCSILACGRRCYGAGCIGSTTVADFGHD